jgi:hypothetical protein
LIEASMGIGFPRQITKYQRFLMHVPDEQFQRTAKEEIAELKKKLREMDE